MSLENKHEVESKAKLLLEKGLPGTEAIQAIRREFGVSLIEARNALLAAREAISDDCGKGKKDNLDRG